MTAGALALVLGAAVLHATWNLFAKRAGAGGVGFVWLCAVLAAAIYAPVTIVVLFVTRPQLGGTELLFLVGSGALHACYFTLLQRGYRVGDLSVVYPLARGTGPMLSTALAIVFIGERPSALALAGAALVCGGVFVVGRATTRDGTRGSARAGVVFGLATGVLIATYTLWDRHAVAELAIPALILDWAANAVRGALLTPFVLARRAALREIWAAHRRDVIAVALFAPLAYILVLTALAVSPVSYVAPAREISILIGTVLGARVLQEGRLGPRMAGATAMVMGLVALAVG
ncbi:MAG: DMT family transporter [Actinomycetota bacterium]